MKPTVLIVDDDPQLRMVFTEFLADTCEVLTAESGDAALDAMTEDVDVVLLDRRMPGKHGDEVLNTLRERGYDQPVALVTAIEPDFDILELGFDDYVVKPVSQDDLLNLVETLVLRREYDEVMREYFAYVSKVTTLQAQKHDDELAQNDQYKDSIDRLGEIKTQARRAIQIAIDSGKFDEIFFDLEDPSELPDHADSPSDEDP